MTKDKNVSPEENPSVEASAVKEEAKKVSFADLGLKADILENLNKLGFEYPTEIQEKAIPEVLKGSSDILGIAQTGTGKTAAFGLPMLNMIDLKNKDIQGLVVAPTRELAIQITDELNRLKGNMRCSIATVYGGQSYELQFRKLRDRPAIIVGTPGRLIDHLNRKSIKLSSLRFLVLDEADDMLNMGFVDDVEKILSHAPEKKQMLLFSATMPRELKKIVNKYMSEDKVEVVVKKKTQTTTLVSQHYMDVYREDKLQALRRIIDQSPGFYGIVFCRTKNDVDNVNQSLVELGYSSEALHGDISQAQREKIIRRFKAGRLAIVIATDVASRGVDVKGLNHVINYELPQDCESYVHRIGRTGRAGNTGKAISLISPREFSMLNQIMRATKADIKKDKVPSIKDIIESQKVTLVESVTTKVTELSADDKKSSLAEYTQVATKLIEDADCVNTLLASVLHLVSEGKFEAKSYPEIQEVSGGRRRDGGGRRGDRFSSRDGGRRGDRFSSRDGGRRGDRRDRGDRRGGERSDRGDRRGGERSDRGDRRGGSKFSQSADKTRIFVAQGLKQKTDRNELVDMIVNKTSTNKAKITNVRVFDDFSFVTVPNTEASKILSKFSTEKVGGRPFMEVARN